MVKMSLFYGDCVDNKNFCRNYGEAFSTVCDDKILVKAIRMMNNHEYTTTFLNNGDGNIIARKVFHDNFMWPDNFKTRIAKYSDLFYKKYGVIIISSDAKLLVGNKLEKKKVISIESNELQILFVDERKFIDKTLNEMSKNVCSKGHYFLIF